MTENKTRPTGTAVEGFLNKIKDEQVRKDCVALARMMQAASRKEPVMWGSAIVGFGNVHYKYESGREGDIMAIGFSPRKQAITIYMMCALDTVKDDLARLGKYKTGKGCLYVKSLDDVDAATLKKILKTGYQVAQKRNAPASAS